MLCKYRNSVVKKKPRKLQDSLRSNKHETNNTNFRIVAEFWKAADCNKRRKTEKASEDAANRESWGGKEWQKGWKPLHAQIVLNKWLLLSRIMEIPPSKYCTKRLPNSSLTRWWVIDYILYLSIWKAIFMVDMFLYCLLFWVYTHCSGRMQAEMRQFLKRAYFLDP